MSKMGPLLAAITATTILAAGPAWATSRAETSPQAKVLKSDAGRQQVAEQVSPKGPEPPTAPDPKYKPMTKEPVYQPTKQAPVSLTDGKAIKGPAGGPEPPTAPDPQYKPMTKEPVYQGNSSK